MKKHLVFINLGDCRAVHARSKKVHFITRDHKPNLQSEETRICQVGLARRRLLFCVGLLGG